MKSLDFLRARPGALFVPALLLFGACGSTDAAVSFEPVAPVAPDASAVTRLLEDVTWLADDEREGRRAGTQACRDAATWIAQRLEEIGLEPAGEDGWMQSLDVPLPAHDGGGSKLAMSSVAFEGPDQLTPLFCSDGGSAEGRLVWGGYGIVNEERGWDDYAFARRTGALEGALVLLVRGTPPVEEAPAEEVDDTALVQHGSGWGNSGSLFTKVMTAKRLGARAVLIAPHPSQGGQALPRFDASRPAQASIPCAFVSLDVARALEPAYERFVASLDRGEGPAAFRPRSAPSLALSTDVVRARGAAWNVLARLRGRDSSRAVVVGAHYDHLGHGGEGSLAPDALGQIHNGADDNASGTAAVIEMARRLASGPRPACDVVFALWTGEEEGLLGSEHWAKHPTVPIESVVANLNLDMVGRAGDGKLDVLGVGSAAPFQAWLEEIGPAFELDLTLNTSGQGVGGSDHQSFLKRRIPALHFFSGVHLDYHKPSDDVAGFEADGAERVATLGTEVVRRMAVAAGQLDYVEPAAPAEGQGAAARRQGSGWSVWFGTVPEYGYEGGGLLLSGTSPGSPAEGAGLLAGDVLTRVGEVEIETIYDFVHALQTYRPGNVVLTRYLREGEEREVRITLGIRDAQ